ncbi:2aab856b-7267-48cd-8417-ed9680a17682 [Sclerotinia trifoliorum]|uniref:2aab856b-7267-48cd-8417-ed9680a17682 n=1 Tax=Sclerotinia trifoliorum TaxID=28548 RepID=A0A8H2W5K3_9HELO|nr:2aab856b-7267-48cd-8417-ed9680a17682 [Sclerotinia trifoliorum]
MASKSKERKLYITPIYSLPASSRLSTSNLFSPTALEKPSFDIRPESSPALPTSSLYRKHHQKEMSGYVTTDEEFHALPPALKRKYFSTLERLRFAQNSRSNALNDLPVQTTRKSSIADRRGLKISELEPRRRSSKPSKKKKEQSISHGNDKSWYLSNYETFPDTIKRKQFSSEEQAVLSGRIREAVILDAADENLIIRRRSRRKASEPPILSPSFRSSIFSGKTSGSRRRASLSSMADTFFDSIHWIDEEPKLDLYLDDYHASIFPSLNSDRKPSFRRQMSISKLPFGRSSIHSAEPKSPSIISPTFSTHSRSKSRGLPAGGPKHAARHKVNSSLSSIDPNATHYQDPEARLKLRVYLASPQKFDEIIEFGFPSMDATVGTPDRENRPPKLISRRSSRDMLRKKISSPAFEHTFFNDDTASLFEDDRSMADSDAPITPLEYESGFPSQRSPSYYYGKPLADYQPGSTKLPGKQQDSYTQCMAGNREPTLRMTLTRQDLRDESAIYGWQSKEPLIMEDVENQKCSRGPISGTDSWGSTEKENGVVKRFWNKVKSQRKTS